MFNLTKIEKEVIPYNLYTPENIKTRYVKISKVLPLLEPWEFKQFVENINKWNLRKENYTFDIIEYSRLYCELDCKVLFQGYNVFRGWILDQLQIDVNGVLTSAALSIRYLMEQGCYDNVYELSGVV